MTRYFRTTEIHFETVHCQCHGIGSLTFTCGLFLSSLISMKCRPSCKMKEPGEHWSFVDRPVFVRHA